MMRDPVPNPGFQWGEITKAIGLIIGLIVLVCALGIGGVAGCKSFNRYQRTADAHNRINVERNYVDVKEQQAEQRYQESIGIRKAQDEINATLTPLYVQHEAISALRDSGAATVYIPSGSQGVPLVRDTSEDHTTVAK